MKIILKGKDNSVAIMELAPGADKDEAIRKLNEHHPEMEYIHMEGLFKLPESREHRDSWRFSEGRIVELGE